MSTTKSAVKSLTPSIGVLTLLFSAIGYFLYGGLNGFFGVFILCILLDFAALLGIIPVVGVVLYYFIGKITIMPWIFSFTGINATWLTNVIFWLDFVGAIVLTVVGIFLILLAAVWKS